MCWRDLSSPSHGCSEGTSRKPCCFLKGSLSFLSAILNVFSVSLMFHCDVSRHGFYLFVCLFVCSG